MVDASLECLTDLDTEGPAQAPVEHSSRLFIGNGPFCSQKLPVPFTSCVSACAMLSALIYLEKLERAAGIEPATYSLGRSWTQAYFSFLFSCLSISCECCSGFSRDLMRLWCAERRAASSMTRAVIASATSSTRA